MIIRLSFLPLMAVLCIVTLSRAQDVISTSTLDARFYEADERRQEHIETATFFPTRHGNFVRSSRTSEKTRLYLAIQLVRRPQLNGQQRRVILDAISLSDSFTASSEVSGKQAKANEALQALKRRALAVFSKKDAAEIFADRAGGEAGDDILKMYYDVSALPLKQRKASFRNASSTGKSDLWRTHLALFLVKRSPELNEWQKEIILTAMSLATPEYFEVRPNSPNWKSKVRDPLHSLEEQILAAFSFEGGAKIFATLGDDSEAAKRAQPQAGSVSLNRITYLQLSSPGPYLDRSTNQFARQDMYVERGACVCSTDSDWCPISGYCNGGNCSPTQNGCGTLWTYPCNGASCG
jgi:hypothetical protein